MRPLCTFCNSFAAVVQVTERLGDGTVLDQTFYCVGHARSEGVRGAHAADVLVVAEPLNLEGASS